MHMTTFSVPGNLLLAGEYAVLEEAGLGLAVAVEPRVLVRVSTPPGLKGLHFRGITGTGVFGFAFSAPACGPDAFPYRMVAAAVGREHTAEGPAYRRCAATTCPPAGLIEVDSRALYRPDGRKAGLGSSAALAVAVTAAVGELVGRSYRGRLDALMRTAVCVHREAQGGHGSGYDVATSVYGGVIEFVGGRRPRVFCIGDAPLWDARLVFGSAAVSTRGAVERYRRWRDAHPRNATAFLSASNEAVLELARSLHSTRQQFAAALTNAGRIGAELGDDIGVPAVLSPDGGGSVEDVDAFKALGAGGEIGIALGNPTREGSFDSIRSVERVEPSYKGIYWN